jgi:hypothetical protein
MMEALYLEAIDILRVQYEYYNPNSYLQPLFTVGTFYNVNVS